MDGHEALDWSPPSDWTQLTVIEAHTGGEPFRVVVSGLPPIPGDTILERRRYAAEHLDHLRRALMWEPRGHADMYGGWIGPPIDPTSDVSVLFLHNDGFSTMCGHGIIALSKILIDTGIVTGRSPSTTLRIDTPAGQIAATSDIEDDIVVFTRFRNVPSFAVAIDARIDVEAFGPVTYDLVFGGAYYALVDAASVGLDLDDAAGLIQWGRRIKRAIAAATTIAHPGDSDLGFLYGVIFTGPASSGDAHSRNVCVFADGEVDRSPTGTGVSARLAALHERGELALGEEIVVESITGSRFTGRIVEVRGDETTLVIPEVGGSAHLTGRAEMWLDPTDGLGKGFFLR